MTEKIRVTRQQIETQQAEWEERQPPEFAFDENGDIYMPGFDMSKFKEVVGPRRYYSYLGEMGLAHISAPPEHVTFADVMGAEGTKAAIDEARAQRDEAQTAKNNQRRARNWRRGRRSLR
jgi:hypothetical protein